MPPCINEQAATHWKAEYVALCKKIYSARWRDEVFKANLRLIAHQREEMRLLEFEFGGASGIPASPKIGLTKSKAKKKSKK